jgi:hypothetical protein
MCHPLVDGDADDGQAPASSHYLEVWEAQRGQVADYAFG